MIKDCIMYNCDARIEMDANNYVAVGQSTEVALIEFLQDADVPVHLLITKKFGKIKASCPFSPQTKRSAVVVESEQPGSIMVFVKGAPEVVVNMCDRQLANDGQADLGDDEKYQILEKVTAMAAKPLRVMTLAYVEMDEGSWANYENTGVTPEQAIEEAFQNG
jgi:P-type Ca2+ transporter type 2C